MSTSVTIQIPEEILIEALQQLPVERRRQLLQQVNDEQESGLVLLPAEVLQELTGIVEIGGDALIESEQIYDE